MEEQEVTLARLQRQRRALENPDIRPNLIEQQQLTKPGSKGDTGETWQRDAGPGGQRAELRFHCSWKGAALGLAPTSPCLHPSPLRKPLPAQPLSPSPLHTCPEPIESKQHRKQELSLHYDWVGSSSKGDWDILTRILCWFPTGSDDSGATEALGRPWSFGFDCPAPFLGCPQGSCGDLGDKLTLGLGGGVSGGGALHRSVAELPFGGRPFFRTRVPGGSPCLGLLAFLEREGKPQVGCWPVYTLFEFASSQR